jgi:hypothetical protein
MEKSNGSTKPGENSEEIVQDILGEVVGDIPSHNQLDGMAEEHEAEAVTNEFEEIAPDGSNAPHPEGSKAPEAVQEPRPSISKEASAESSTDSTSEMDNVYHVKWIGWNSNKTPIITQNSNGPCPMLAITNILLLRGKMALPDGCEIVSSEQLLENLADTMLECVPKNLDPDRRLDYEANVSDAVIVLPKLQTGIDVNVKFSSGVKDFEYTNESIIFDLFNIALYHGWLVDPQQEDVVRAVDGLSYNQLVEKIIANKNNTDSNLVTDSLVAQNFLEESASQLTYHGLCELGTTMKENELAIFFRNNHFSTIYKRNNELFLLVTDQGFLKESTVVWETLNSIDGDGQFVDSNFITAPPKASPKLSPSKTATSPTNLSPEQQLDQDLQLAKALTESDAQQHQRDEEWESYKETRLGDTSGLTDEELARRLQEEENSQVQERAEASQPQRAAAAGTASTSRDATGSGSPGRNQSGNSSSSQRTKNCTIL